MITDRMAEDVDTRLKKQHRERLRARKAYHVQANLGMMLGQRFIDICGHVQLAHADALRAAVDKWASAAELRLLAGQIEKRQEKTPRQKRVHIRVYASDWEALEKLYGKGIKRGTVVRTLIRDYRTRVETEGEKKL